MIVRGETLEPIEFDGLSIFDYTAVAKTDSSMAVIEVPSGATHRESWSRRSGKYYLVISGRIQFILDGNEISLASRDFCFVEQGKRFSYRNDGPSMAVLVLVHTPSFDIESEVFES
jgi:mannose-6-phosphate isomerase-like protein (cupin superfamily)